VGANSISAAKLWLIAHALEVPISYFYEGIAPSARETRPTPPVSEEVLRTFVRLKPPQRHALLGVATSLAGRAAGTND
jgi:hypothetical protein